MTNKPPPPDINGIVEYHPSNRVRKADWIDATGNLHEKGSRVLVPLSSLDVKRLRIDYLRNGLNLAELSKKYNIIEVEVGRIIRYDIRDESLACPDEKEYMYSTRWRPDNAKQGSAAINKRPHKTIRPYLVREQVVIIRLMYRAGMLDGLAKQRAYAEHLGIYLESLIGIIEGQLFMTTHYYPSELEEEEFCKVHGIKNMRW